MKQRDLDDQPASRRDVSYDVAIQARDTERWLLGAIALVSLHLLQFMALSMPWKAKPGEENLSGWDFIGEWAAGSRWAFFSVMLLIAAGVAVFSGLSNRRMSTFYAVAAMSAIRAAMILTATYQANDWASRIGVAFSLCLAVITAIASLVVADRVDD